MRKPAVVSYCCLLLSCVMLINLHAQVTVNTKTDKANTVTRTKNFSKSYPLGSDDQVQFENQYANIQFNVWDKKELKVEINSTVVGNDATAVETILQRITNTEEKKDKLIRFRTAFEKSNKSSTGVTVQMDIRINVYLPASTPLSITSSFGSIHLPDYNGELVVNSTYGSLNAGKISNAKNILVKFGSVKVVSLSNSFMDISFSSGTIQQLNGVVEGVVKHCTPLKMGLSNQLARLNLESNFATLELKPTPDFNGDFQIVSADGDLTNKSTIDFKKEEIIKPGSNRKIYKGKSGTGKIPVLLQSKYGSLIIGS